MAVAIAGAATLLQDHGLPVSAARATTPTHGGSLGVGVVGIVGVLRHPQTRSDLDRRALEQISLASGSRARAWWGTPVRSLIRLATVTPWGDKVFLAAFRPPSRASFERVSARLGFSAALRRRDLNRLTRLGYAVGIVVLGKGGSCCESVASIEAGAAALQSGPSPNTVVLLVPDGVAKVTLQLNPPVTATVRDNVAAFVVRQHVENLSLGKMIWYGPTGVIVKRIG